jgi:RHS repeat-associated protein
MPEVDQACCEEQIGGPVDILTGTMTYTSSTDATVSTGAGSYLFRREYSSARAVYDLFADELGSGFVFGAYGAGWSHELERRVIRVSDHEIIYLRPTGEPERFFGDGHVWRGEHHPALRIEETPNGWQLVAPDGTRYAFESLATAPDHGVLVSVEEASGQSWSLEYYESGASRPECGLANSNHDGRLCVATSNQGVFLHFAAYSPVTCDQAECSACAGFGCSDSPPRLREVRLGRGGSLSAFNERVTYDYIGKPRFDDVGETTGTTASLLVKATREAFEQGAHHVADSQSYSYTRKVYYTGVFPYDESSTPILTKLTGVDAAVTLDLLRRVRDHAGEFVEGHEYDNLGRAATSEVAGEHLTFRYVHGRRIVDNASAGSTVEYLISEGGHLEAISDSCGCGADTESIERDARGRVLAKTSAKGRRNVFYYDNFGRVTLQLSGQQGATSEFEGGESSEMPVLSPEPAQSEVPEIVRIRRVRYGIPGFSMPTEESPVYSALCPSYWGGVACPADFDTRPPRTVFDYDDDYDDIPNEAPTTRVRRELRSGFTLSNLGANRMSAEWTELTTEWHFDEAGRLIRTADPMGHATVYRYNPEGHLERTEWVEFGVGHVTVLETRGDFDAGGPPGWSVDELGVTSTFTYDEAGRVTAIAREIAGMTRTTEYIYSSNGRIQFVQQSAGGTTEVLQSETQYFHGSEEIPSPASEAFCETQKQPFSQEDFEACVLGLAGLGRVTDRLSGVLSDNQFYVWSSDHLEYNSRGLVTLSASLDASGTVRRQRGMEYDSKGRLIREFIYTSDPMRRQYVRDTYWDAWNYQRVTDPRFMAGDPGAIPDYSDNRANVNRQSRTNAFGRISSVFHDMNDPTYPATRYHYDRRGNLLRVKDATGLTTTTLYDDFGRLVVELRPGGLATAYTYDAAGNVSSMKRNGAVYNYTYDGRNRLTSDGVSVFNYDLLDPATTGAFEGSFLCEDGREVDFVLQNTAGRLTAVLHQAGATYYSYTPFGEVELVFEQHGDWFEPCKLESTRYARDALGRLTSITYPSGRIVRYEFNPGDLWPTGVTVEGPVSHAVASAITYDADGSVRGFVGTAVDVTVERNLEGHVISSRYESGGEELFDWDASARDGDGNPTVVRDRATPNYLSVGYDGQGRLNRVRGRMRGYQDCTYKYDAVGNRTTETCYDRPITYEYEDDSTQTHVLSEQSWTHEHPGQCGTGNLKEERRATNAHVGRGHVRRTYPEKFPRGDGYVDLEIDELDRVLAASRRGGGAVKFYYDHRKLRTSKERAECSWCPVTGWTDFTYGADGNLLAEQDSVGITREYIWLAGQPIAVIIDNGLGEELYVLGLDHLGTPMRAFAADTGAIAWAADYEAFGKAWEYLPDSRAKPGIEINIRFPGQYLDRETGLHYNWHRYYDPNTGRYPTADPMGVQSDPSFYSYAAGNPLNRIDPNGLSASGRRLPHSSLHCQKLWEKLGRNWAEVRKRIVALVNNPQRLPYWDPTKPPKETVLGHAGPLLDSLGGLVKNYLRYISECGSDCDGDGDADTEELKRELKEIQRFLNSIPREVLDALKAPPQSPHPPGPVPPPIPPVVPIPVW